MMKSKVVVFGIGSFSEFVSYTINQDSPHEVVAFCCERAFKPAGSVQLSGLPIVEFESIEQHYPPEGHRMFIAIGENKLRKTLFDMVKSKGYQFVSYVSSKAESWDDLRIGDNVFVSEGCLLQPFTSIGDNTMVITSTIGHHAVIGANSLISGCTLGANVVVESNSFIGMGSSVGHATNIGADNIVGMRSIIDCDTGDGEVYNQKPTRKRAVSAYRFKDRYL